MPRWLLYALTASSLGCAGHGSAVLPGSISIFEDTCNSSDPGFEARMHALALSVWQMNDGSGPVEYRGSETSKDACPIDRIYRVTLFPDGSGFVGNVTAMRVAQCEQMTCVMAYMVGSQ